MKTIAVHQPNYLPWPGFFFKILHADVFVLLDNVDYQSGNAGSITNRTRIKGPDGPVLLTVPVKRPHQDRRINEVVIDYSSPWPEKHLRSFEFFYSRAPHFRQYFAGLEETLGLRFVKLAALNEALVRRLAGWLAIRTEIVTAGSLELTNTGPNERIVEICTKLGGDIYLSGTGAKKYNNEAMFREHGIRLAYTDFTQQPYPQCFRDFIPGLSMMDCLFNCGERSIDYLYGGGNGIANM